MCKTESVLTGLQSFVAEEISFLPSNKAGLFFSSISSQVLYWFRKIYDIVIYMSHLLLSKGTLFVMKRKKDLSPKLAVVGVGGAGSNAVNNMIRSGLTGVEFVVCNTDAQALKESLAEFKIQLGPEVTKGLGAGSKPDVGKAAAEESIETVMSALKGVNMIL